MTTQIGLFAPSFTPARSCPVYDDACRRGCATVCSARMALQRPAPVPAVRTSPESVEAAKRHNPAALRAAVFGVIVAAGSDGLTDMEIAARLPDEKPDSVRARRVGLVKSRLVEKAAHRRRSPSGNPAGVWVATREGER